MENELHCIPPEIPPAGTPRSNDEWDPPAVTVSSKILIYGDITLLSGAIICLFDVLTPFIITP